MRVIMDFELASKQAIHDIYGSEVQAHGCHFHYTQSLRRKIDEYAKRYYRDNKVFALFIRHLMALPLAKPQHVAHYFEQLMIKYRGLLGNDTPRLLIPMKRVHGKNMDWLSRTNNNVEAWHRAIQQTVRQKHPTIESLIEVLKQEEAVANLGIAHSLAGDVPPFIRRQKYFTLNERFKKVFNRLQPQSITFPWWNRSEHSLVILPFSNCVIIVIVRFVFCH